MSMAANQWEQEGQLGKFQSAIVDGLSAYCNNSANLAACGSTVGLPFNASAVAITTGYPINNGSWYMDLRFSISYATSGVSLYTMPTSAVAEITANQRQSIKDNLGYYIVYIGSKFYTLPPPTLVNQVVVPVSVLATALLVALAVGLRHRQRDEDLASLLRAGKLNTPAGSRSIKVVGSASDDAQSPPPPAGPEPSWRSRANGSHGPAGATTAVNEGRQNPGFDKSLGGEYEMTRARAPPAEEPGGRRSRRRQEELDREPGDTEAAVAEAGKAKKSEKAKQKKKHRQRHDSEGRAAARRRHEVDSTDQAATLVEAGGEPADLVGLDFHGGGPQLQRRAMPTVEESPAAGRLRSPVVEI